MSIHKSLYFPLDNLVDGEIENRDPGSCTVESSLRNSSINFDDIRGSFLELSQHDHVEMHLSQEWKIESKSVLVVSIFLSFHDQTGQKAEVLGINGNTVIAIDPSGVLLVWGKKSIQMEPHKWVNLSLMIDLAQVCINLNDLQVFTSPIDELPIPLSIEKFSILAGSSTALQYSDLYLQMVDGMDNLRRIFENQSILKSEIYNRISCKLFTHGSTEDLSLENESLMVLLGLRFQGMDVHLLEDQPIHGRLKVKPGFLRGNSEKRAMEENSGKGFSFNLIRSDNGITFKAEFDGLELVSGAQRSLSYQLELFALSLSRKGSAKQYTEEEPLLIDGSVPIVDRRGSEINPFELLVLGNDTLCNFGETAGQILRLRLINVSGTAVRFQDQPASTLRITSYQMGIFKEDSFQQVRIEINKGTFLQENGLALRLESAMDLGPGEWVDITMSGLHPVSGDQEFPSGSYPFHLEFTNIQNFRNGSLPFTVRTGRIFYTYNN